jgi:hypothetical protein
MLANPALQTQFPLALPVMALAVRTVHEYCLLVHALCWGFGITTRIRASARLAPIQDAFPVLILLQFVQPALAQSAILLLALELYQPAAVLMATMITLCILIVRLAQPNV